MSYQQERTDLQCFSAFVAWAFAEPASKPSKEQPEAWEQIEHPESLEGRVEVAKTRFAAGGSSLLYKGYLRTDSTNTIEVAVKCFGYYQERCTKVEAAQETSKLIAREVKVWRNLCHPNIVKFHGIIMAQVYPWMSLLGPEEPLYPAIVCSYCDGGKITTYLQSHPQTLRLPLILDAAKGLEYLHANNIAHGDVKPENILIKSSTDGVRAAISDFGSSRIIDDDSFSGTLAFTWPYMAPEILKAPYFYTKPSDVFCFALSALVIISGKQIFEEEERYDARTKLENGDRPVRDDHPCSEMSDDLWQLIEDCWAQEPDRRKEMGEVTTRLGAITSR